MPLRIEEWCLASLLNRANERRALVKYITNAIFLCLAYYRKGKPKFLAKVYCLDLEHCTSWYMTQECLQCMYIAHCVWRNIITWVMPIWNRGVVMRLTAWELDVNWFPFFPWRLEFCVARQKSKVQFPFRDALERSGFH